MPTNADLMGANPVAQRELALLNDKIADSGKTEGKKAAAKDSEPGAGPIVLGLFMLCILVHALIYVYNSTADFWHEIQVTSFKSALVHDYRDEPAAVAAAVMAPPAEAAPLPVLPEDTWHHVAPGSDADELRVALRLGSLSRSARPTSWNNQATGHSGIVTPIDLAADAEGCRRSHIARRDDASLSDNVDFCADGSIRQGMK